MKIPAIVAGVLAVLFVCLFTSLLLMERITEWTYASLLVSFGLLCIVILVLPRLKELDLRGLRLTLQEIRQVKSEIEEVKEDIVGMYGGIDAFRKHPLVLDDAKMKALGLELNPNVHQTPSLSAVMRYPTGCIKRERERLARIFISGKTPEKIAEAILDGSLDDKVFKWEGPEAPLDSEPRSADARAKAREQRQSIR